MQFNCFKYLDCCKKSGFKFFIIYFCKWFLINDDYQEFWELTVKKSYQESDVSHLKHKTWIIPGQVTQLVSVSSTAK